MQPSCPREVVRSTRRTCGFAFIPAAWWVGVEEKRENTKCASDHSDVVAMTLVEVVGNIEMT